MTDEKVDETAVFEGEVEDYTPADDSVVEDASVEAEPDNRPQYGVGPFSIREVALVGVWLVAFIVSFFSIAGHEVLGDLLFGGSVWANGVDWILTIGVPTIAVFLIVLRRFSPDGIRRVGSLGIDQFASVAFSVSAIVWLTILWRGVSIAINASVWIYGWVAWVSFFLAVAGVVLTVFAPVIPVLSEDFTGRREVAAHRNARPIRQVTARPPKPVVATAEPEAYTAADPYAPATDGVEPYTEQSQLSAENPYGSENPYGAENPYGSENPYASEDPYVAHAAESTTVVDVVEEDDSSLDDTVSSVGAHSPQQQAFWALSPEARDVVDERGTAIFRVGPTAWALVLEDRGEVFVIRHEDGRVGYLHDTSGVTRG